MAQFYFISVIANFLVGMALAGGFIGEKLTDLSRWKELQTKRGKLIAIALFAVVAGILKLIFKSPGEEVLLAGDLLPAATGIILGVLLFIDTLKRKTEQPLSAGDKQSRTVLNYKVPMGIAGLIIAALHFLFPGTLFL